MAGTPSVGELVVRWQERQRQGQSVSPEEICADCPELLDEVKRHIEAVAAMEGFLGLDGKPSRAENTPGTEPTTTDYVAKPGTPFPGTPPILIPGYEVLGELGRGGMGIVYKAQDLVLKRVVALKMVLAGACASEVHRTRFRTEAEAAARLLHPHVVQVFAWGEQAGQPYLVLEFVDGPSLARKVKGQPQPPGDAARLVLLLARAVHAAHQKGIIHRDLKPANVLLSPPADEPALNTAYGCPKIADFGLAKLPEERDGPTASGYVLGTPSYMAPEQATGKSREAGPATDIHALGVILYELLVGRPPFKGDSVLDTLEQVRSRLPEPPSQVQAGVPADLEAICLKCLHKEPRARYASAAALAEDLHRFLDGKIVTLPPANPPASSWFRPSRVAVALAAVTLIGVLLVVFRPSRSPERTGGTESGSGHLPESVPAALPALQGYIDVQVYDPKDRRRQDLRLNDPGALPLKAGDQFSIEAKLNRPAYLYVLWIDSTGKVSPIYPWRPGHWKDRPAVEKPVQSLRRPEPLDEFYTIEPGVPGMETIVLLARETPLEPAVDLRVELGPLPRQVGQSLRATAWFENGEVVRTEKERGSNFDATKRDDPVLETQQRIREVQREYFTYSRAVSFANQGR
jgi:serine/threonine protein kinase